MTSSKSAPIAPDNLLDEKISCWGCQSRIELIDRFCRHCGMGQGAALSWYYRPFWIGVLAIFVLGPFVLPMVWRSPKLSTAGRWGWTIFVAVLTIYLVYSIPRALAFWKPLLGVPS